VMFLFRFAWETILKWIASIVSCTQWSRSLTYCFSKRLITQNSSKVEIYGNKIIDIPALGVVH
jgi:hypothetical protein